jgi:hypothetical protein
MRLSWYADTGIAVFSIWQGGRCTGTFRLPIDDLPRMIGILERGPQGVRAAPEDPRPEPEDYRTSGYQRDDYDRGYRPDETAAYGQTGGYRQDSYADAAGYEAPAGAYWREEGGHQLDAAGPEGFDGTDLDGYGQERFVPPYVQPPAESYPNDNLAAGPARGRGRGGPAYPGDAPADYPEPDRYPLRSRSRPGYSGSSEYRLTADAEAASRHSAGKHSSQRPAPDVPRRPDDAEPPAGSEQESQPEYWRRPAR